MTREQNPGLQWMRAIAALLVVVDHCLFTLIDKAGADMALAPLAVVFGSTGVGLFFIISGFVMIVSSTENFGAAASLEFMRRRLIRIVPLYWITTLIYALKLWQFGSPPEGEALLRSLFFIPYLNEQGEMHPVYGLGWTLNYELFFYLLFAVGLLGSLRSLLMLVGAGLLVLLGLGSWLGLDGLGRVLFFWSQPIVLFFLAGMTLPFAIRALRARGFPEFSLTLSVVVALASIALVLLLSALGTLPLLPKFLLLMLPVLLLSLARRGSAGRFLPALACRLGDASYSIYLTHSFAIGPLARIYAKLGWSSPLPFIIISLLVCSILGMLCYRFVEKPLLRLLGGWTAPRRVVVPG